MTSRSSFLTVFSSLALTDRLRIVKLFLGTTDTDDESKLLREIGGNFGSTFNLNFIASLDGEEIGGLPSFESDFFLTLELKMDAYPEELALRLLASPSDQSAESEQVLFFRTPRYYADRGYEVVTERIPIPDPSNGTCREYTFIIIDR